MTDRRNTIVCIFDPTSPRISAFQIHEWIYEQLHLPEHDVRMVQIDGPRRRVYMKFIDYEQMQTVFQVTNGQTEFRHDNGEISQVKVEIAGVGTRRIRVANLPPEIPDYVIAFDFAHFLLDCLTFENGTDRGPETSVTNYKSTLHNIPEGRRAKISSAERNECWLITPTELLEPSLNLYCASVIIDLPSR
jgi:hypothetical protein